MHNSGVTKVDSMVVAADFTVVVTGTPLKQFDPTRGSINLTREPA